MKSIRHMFMPLAAVFLLCSSVILHAEDDSEALVSKESVDAEEEAQTTIKESLLKLWKSTGIYGFLNGEPIQHAEPKEEKPEKKETADKRSGSGMLIMIGIGLLLIYLGISKGFEPLLLIPIGFGCVLANVPYAGVVHGAEFPFLALIFDVGIQTGIFPLLIFMGVGAMTDFGPLIANPKTALLGAAAQFGIFATVLGAIWLSKNVEAINYSIQDAGAIGIIGGADGPTAIFLAGKLAPDLLGAIAVAAYSYMALVPIIQPPIMKLLTTEEERKIGMKQLRHVSQAEKIVFPVMVLVLCGLLLPSATPLVGMLMLGNLLNQACPRATLWRAPGLMPLLALLGDFDLDATLADGGAGDNFLLQPTTYTPWTTLKKNCPKNFGRKHFGPKASLAEIA